jgi:hypothetical protein
VRATAPYPVAVIVWFAAGSPEAAQGEARRLFPGHDGACAVVVVNGVAVDTDELGEATLTPAGRWPGRRRRLRAGAYGKANLIAAARAFQEHCGVAAAVNAVNGNGGVELAPTPTAGLPARSRGCPAPRRRGRPCWSSTPGWGPRRPSTPRTTARSLSSPTTSVGHWHERFDHPRPADDRAAIDQYFQGNDHEDYHVLDAEWRP